MNAWPRDTCEPLCSPWNLIWVSLCPDPNLSQMLCSCEFSPGAAALWVVGASCLVSVWCELLRALRSEADVIYFVLLLREADAHMGTIWIHRINCVFFGSSLCVFVCTHIQLHSEMVCRAHLFLWVWLFRVHLCRVFLPFIGFFSQVTEWEVVRECACRKDGPCCLLNLI